MKSIRELIGSKPSKAVQAMLDGLIEQSKRSNFEIDMNDYGDSLGKMCFGCAATCTIQKLANKNFTNGKILSVETRAKNLGFNINELIKFEYAINSLRMGRAKYIFDFCEIKIENKNNLLLPNFFLRTDDWQEQIPQVEAYIKQLQNAGY